MYQPTEFRILLAGEPGAFVCRHESIDVGRPLIEEYKSSIRTDYPEANAARLPRVWTEQSEAVLGMLERLPMAEPKLRIRKMEDIMHRPTP